MSKPKHSELMMLLVVPGLLAAPATMANAQDLAAPAQLAQALPAQDPNNAPENEEDKKKKGKKPGQNPNQNSNQDPGAKQRPANQGQNSADQQKEGASGNNAAERQKRVQERQDQRQEKRNERAQRPDKQDDAARETPANAQRPDGDKPDDARGNEEKRNERVQRPDRPGNDTRETPAGQNAQRPDRVRPDDAGGNAEKPNERAQRPNKPGDDARDTPPGQNVERPDRANPNQNARDKNEPPAGTAQTPPAGNAAPPVATSPAGTPDTNKTVETPPAGNTDAPPPAAATAPDATERPADRDRANRDDPRNDRRDAREDRREDRREKREDARDDRREDRDAGRNANTNKGPVGERPSPAAAKEIFVAPPKPARNFEQVKRERKEESSKDGKTTVIREGDNRVIIKQDNRVIIRTDDSDRFRRVAKNAETNRRNDGSVETVYVRPDGVRVYNVVDRDGRILQRYRRDRSGRDVVIIDNRRYYGGDRDRGFSGRDLAIGVGVGVAVGAAIVALAPPVVSIPREQYIVDYSRASDDDLYEALTAPPVERLERTYSLEEIRYNAPLRQRMRRIDVDTVTFDFGSWEVSPNQYGALERIANVVNRALDRNSNEVFLIEGHTDAVGSDDDNLTLSDRRAQTVAEILTSNYGVPPENLVTQGYGEEQLKVDTQEPERDNRRIAFRRVTPLMSDQSQSQSRAQ